MPRWRNGRRVGLKIRLGSNSVPVQVRPGANKKPLERVVFLLKFFLQKVIII